MQPGSIVNYDETQYCDDSGKQIENLKGVLKYKFVIDSSRSILFVMMCGWRVTSFLRFSTLVSLYCPALLEKQAALQLLFGKIYRPIYLKELTLLVAIMTSDYYRKIPPEFVNLLMCHSSVH